MEGSGNLTSQPMPSQPALPSLSLHPLGRQACAGTSPQPRPPAPSPSHCSWPVWPQPSPWAPQSLASWSPALVAVPTDVGTRTSRPRGYHALSLFAAWPGCTGQALSRRHRPRTETQHRRPSSTPPFCLHPRPGHRRSWPVCPPRSPRQSCRSSTSATPGVPGSGTRMGTTPRRARAGHVVGTR